MLQPLREVIMQQKEIPQINRIIDGPTLEQQRRTEYVFSRSDGRFRLKYTSNLEKYYGMGSLDEEQFRAGDKLYQDAYYGGVLSQIKGIDLTRCAIPRDKNAMPASMTSEQAYTHKSFSDAFFDQKINEEHRNILWWVCICDNTTSSYQRNRQVTIGLLREALNELARIYKSRKRQY